MSTIDGEPLSSDFTLIDAAEHAHPAWPGFAQAMVGRAFGGEALWDAWLWFRDGWCDGTAPLEDLLHRRGVEDPCERCAGAGCYVYSSSATWRGGMGAASPQRDVCDVCWGTGDRYRTGVDLRRLRSEEAVRVANAAASLLANACGAQLSSCQVQIHKIIDHLETLVDKRNTPADLQGLTQALANTLRRAVGAAERRI